MLLRNLLLISFLALIVSCNTPRTTTLSQPDDRSSSNSLKVDAIHDGLDFTSYLSRLQGVTVSGRGPNANIQIRLPNSLNGDSRPLFVIDGAIMGQDYTQVYNSVDINSIERVTVLKSAMDLTRYGIQGANGVIEIETKK